MTSKFYLFVTGLFFLLFALAHLIRLIFSLPVQINAWTIPVWISWIPFIGAILLSAWAFLLTRSASKS